jgi:alanine racemase
LPVGYADGYRRSLTNKAEVLVCGRRVKQVGTVCMDMMMVDVTDVPDARLGEEVVLLGAQGDERITAQDVADLCDTISYEVFCAIGARVPRVTI